MSSSFRKTLIRRSRTGPPTNVKGRYTPATTSDTNFKASVQPTRPHEVMHLAEGRRNSKTFWLYTDTDLNMITANNPDLVVINSEVYEVWEKGPWQNNVLPHFKVLVGKILEN